MLKQISVFLPNQPGILAKFTKVLLDENINMRAISVADTADYGILRILIEQDKIDKCVEILTKANYLVSLTDVIAVDIPDKPGALHEITLLLGEENVNIEYLYSTILKDEAIIILRIDNVEKAVKILQDKNVKLIGPNDF